MGKKIWDWLGHLFRVKTIGDILGWWTTEHWHQAVSTVIAILGGWITSGLGAQAWTLPLICAGIFWLVIKGLSLKASIARSVTSQGMGGGNESDAGVVSTSNQKPPLRGKIRIFSVLRTFENGAEPAQLPS